MAKAKVELIALKTLVLHPTLQPRPGYALTDAAHVEDLRRAIRKKAKLPRPKVVRVADDGKNPHGLLVWDGFHTVTAHLEEHPSQKIECDVSEGTYDDAYLATGGTNHHEAAGLKRTAEGKRHSVARTLRGLARKNERWPVQRVATYCGVSDSLVKAVTEELEKQTAASPEADIETPPEPVFSTRTNGARQKVKPQPIGKPSENGKAVAAFDWKPFEAAMGVVQRAPDDAARVHTALKGTTEYAGVCRMLGELAEAFSALKKVARQQQEK